MDRAANRNRGRGLPPGSMNPERDAEILRKRDEGASYRDLSQEFDLSHERVRQIIKRERRMRT